MVRKALIVGAGIGGLSAAIALRRAGWQAEIYERAASPRELGFGVVLAPNAMAALRELGMADVVLARGFAPMSVRAELRRMDGTVLRRAEIATREALGGPLVIALRTALHGALLEAVGIDAVRLNSEAVGFTATEERVALQLAAGGIAKGDLLVGADGIGSVTRRTVHPSEPPPRSSGIVAVRGAVHGAAHHLGDLTGVYYLGPGVESFLVPLGVRDPAAVLAHMAPQFDATFRAVTLATEEMRFDELVDRDALPFWGKGAVTLVGDAAHPLLPHTGQGAAQAIVDAVQLGRALREDTDVEPALRSYEQERQHKTAILLAQGRRVARVMRSTNPVASYFRELAARMLPLDMALKVIVRINRRAGTDVRH
jgi:2-polyprenyl-6-methoxyphenol hydroxylase-like FAD-dependent oxidoreductase